MCLCLCVFFYYGLSDHYKGLRISLQTLFCNHPFFFKLPERSFSFPFPFPFFSFFLSTVKMSNSYFVGGNRDIERGLVTWWLLQWRRPNQPAKACTRYFRISAKMWWILAVAVVWRLRRFLSFWHVVLGCKIRSFQRKIHYVRRHFYHVQGCHKCSTGYCRAGRQASSTDNGWQWMSEFKKNEDVGVSDWCGKGKFWKTQILEGLQVL
jgi:hypothetical protein